MDWYILLFFLMYFIEFGMSDIFTDVMRSRDQCKEVCDETQLSLPSKQICQRGCRLFNLERFKGNSFINKTKEDCHSSCSDAYIRKKESGICDLGCDLMAKKKLSETSSDNWMVIIEQEGRGNFMVVQPDLELDSEILLTDPGLRNQIEWSYEYKIPETHIRTMPINDNFGSFGIQSETDDQMKDPSQRTTDWLECAARNSGLPRWLLVAAIVIAILFALWLCLSPEKRTELELSQPFLVNDIEFTPPPKYSLTSDKV